MNKRDYLIRFLNLLLIRLLKHVNDQFFKRILTNPKGIPKLKGAMIGIIILKMIEKTTPFMIPMCVISYYLSKD